MGRNALHHIGTTDSKDRVTVGIDAKGNPVRMEVGPQLRGLTGAGLSDLDPSEANVILEMARSNQIGTFSGDAATPRVYQGPSERRSREDVILDSVRKYEGFGKAGDTAGIIRSANRDLENEAALSGTDAAMGRRQAELAARPGETSGEDNIFIESARRRADTAAERDEITALQKLAIGGRQYDAPDDFVETSEGSGQMVRKEGQKRGARLVTPPASELAKADSVAAKPRVRNIQYTDGSTTQVRVGRPNVRDIQPTRPAATPSIAPTPGDITGNQPAPQIDAGGSGGQPPARTAVAGGPMPDDMRRELFSLPDRGGNTFMSRPEGPGPIAQASQVLPPVWRRESWVRSVYLTWVKKRSESDAI